MQLLATPIINQAVSQLPADSQDAARNALNDIVASASGALGGALAGGGSQGSTAGAGSAANNEVYNEQFDYAAQLTGETKSSNPFSQSLLDLFLQGIRNGLSAIPGLGGGAPSTTSAQGVLVNGAGQATNAVPGTPGLPSNAIFSSGDDNSDGSSPIAANAVPGRVQSRINVTNDGMDHIGDRHLDPTVNASQFTISDKDLTNLLQDPNTVSTPITSTLQSYGGITYVREVNTGQTIGTDKFNSNQPTSIMTVLTDQYGNLVTAFPGKFK